MHSRDNRPGLGCIGTFTSGEAVEYRAGSGLALRGHHVHGLYHFLDRIGKFIFTIPEAPGTQG